MIPLIAIILLALIFDFINGFHDAANSIATIVSTRVLPPRAAVAWAAFFNFIAFLIFSTHLAKNISGGISPETISLTLVGSGLVGAILWNLLTWWLGLPSSSTHALLGGLAGAAIVKTGGFGSLNATFFGKTALFIVLAPMIGLVLGYLSMRLLMLLFGRMAPQKIDRSFRFAQLFSASLYSLGHGGNDAQKTMGVIAMALGIAQGKSIPLWVVLCCHAAMAIGTMSGGWRIVKTMGMKITKLAPVGGFCAETSGAVTLFAATALGVPVSTTHTITGAIVGVGSTQKLTAVRWGVAGRIVWAWLLTIPGAAAISAAAYLLARLIGLPE